MGQTYDCTIPRADFEGLDDDRLINTELLRTDNLRYIDINSGIKLPCNEDLVGLTHTPMEELSQYNSWYLINNLPYYYKNKKSNFVILNELLGEELSKYMQLPTIEYSIVVENDEISGLISQNFLDGTYKHYESRNAPRSIKRLVRDILTDSELDCDQNLKRQLTALLIRNFYSCLKDRNKNSCYGMKDDNLIVTPLFDYESSFVHNDDNVYIDPLISYSFDPYAIKYIDQNNPYFKEYLEMIEEYNILISLKKIEQYHGIKVPQCYIEYYTDFDKTRKAFMKELGLLKK